MKISLILLMFTLLTTFLYSKSPFYMNLMMVLLIFSLSTWALSITNKWLFSLLVIFYLGGMMVLFAYIVSLSKSKYSFFQFKLKMWAFVMMYAMTTYQMSLKPQMFFFKSYCITNWHFLFFLALSLLSLLVIVNKICMAQFGPILYKNND